MKKFLFLTLIFSALFSTSLIAQSGDEPGKNMLQQMKDQQKAPMVAKTGLTEAQVDRIIEINYEIRQAGSVLRNLSEAERAPKIQALHAAKEKMYSEIPLTAEQIQSVKAFYESRRKEMPQPQRGN